MGQNGTANHRRKTGDLVLRSAVAVLVLLLSLFPSIALAADPDEPDDLSILDVQAFRHLLETDDFLLVIEYNIAYDTTPDDPARQWWLARCLSPDDADIGRALPYSYGQNGYQYGIISMYWAADDADIPIWEAANTVRLEGNPTAWDTLPTPVTYTMAPADYCDAATQAGNQYELAYLVLQVFTDIEINWGVPGELVTLTNAGTVLTAEGQHYLLGSVPGSNYMCPDIFAVKDIDLDLDEETWERERDADTEDRYSGTMIEDFKQLLVDSFGGHFHPFFILGALMLLIAILLMAFSYISYGTSEPAYCLVPILVLYFAKLSFTPFAIFGLFTFAAAGYCGWMWLGRNSA